MACCMFIAAIVAGLLWAARRLAPARFEATGAAVSWRPDSQPNRSTAAPPKTAGFSFKARGRSFGYALNGLRVVVQSEHNAWIHIAAAGGVILSGIILQIERTDWLWLTLAIAAVLIAETLNTAIERLCDVVSPDYDLAIGVVKDIAAGAVLISALGAVIIGVLVFGPHIVETDLEAALAANMCRAL